MAKIYFPNLNALRFFAAFAVFVHHIEQFKNILGFSNFWNVNSIQQLGKLGVVLFFVLSGFLITYLLLVEKTTFKKVNVKAFYIRRLLRIWPLYFLIFLGSFFILPQIEFLNLGTWPSSFQDNFSIKFFLYLFFLPHVALAFFQPIPFASQLWSIGTEEYFYILWAPLINRSKNILKLLLFVIALYLSVKIGLKLIDYIYPNSSLLLKIRNAFTLFSIDCMAIGGLFAYVFYKRNKIFNLLLNPKVFFSILAVLIVCLSFGLKVPFLNFEFYSILFGCILLNLATNSTYSNTFENAGLNYLGKISFGIYMFHPLCIVIALKLLAHFNIHAFILQYLLSFILTLLLASFSFHFFEKWFLSKKENFKMVESY